MSASGMEKLTDQNVLAELAINNSEPDVRHESDIMCSPGYLVTGCTQSLEGLGFSGADGVYHPIRIAKKDSVWRVRQAAVKKLTDQNVLAEVAKNDSDGDVRQAAVEKLTDRNVLAEVAKNDSDWRVRKTAFEQLGDRKNALAEVAKNDPGRVFPKKLKHCGGYCPS